MSNRHARRAAKAEAHRNMRRHSASYESYIRHLPQVSVHEPLQPGRVYHQVVFHDTWCAFYNNNNPADCNCKFDLSLHVEPERQ